MNEVLERVQRVVDDAQDVAAAFDADGLDGPAAKQAVALATRLERAAAAIKTLAVRRVERTGAWVAGGDRTPEHWLARVSGTTIGDAAGVVATAARLDQLPATADALRAGQLSPAQASLVADAATLAPDLEPKLLAAAKSSSLTKLRDELAKLRAAAAGPDAQAKIHALRSRRSWIDRHGAFRYEGIMTREAGARFDKTLGAYRDKVFRDARREGRREPHDAYASDALMRMVDAAAGSGAHAESCTLAQLRGVLVVDAHAYVRDELLPGETCELAGIGLIDLPSAKKMLGDAVIDIAITDGVDVRTLAHAGRTPTMKQWLALYAQGAICNVTGCGRRDRLQADHSPEYAITRHTTVEELKLKCEACHHKKTHLGWTDGPRQPDGTHLLLPPSDAKTGRDPPDTR